MGGRRGDVCFKCGEAAFARWKVCADEAERWVCLYHDIELNRLGLTWAYGRRRATEMMARYVAKVMGVDRATGGRS